MFGDAQQTFKAIALRVGVAQFRSRDILAMLSDGGIHDPSLGAVCRITSKG